MVPSAAEIWRDRAVLGLYALMAALGAAALLERFLARR